MNKLFLILLAWVLLTSQIFGAVVIPWGRSLAMPGIIFLHFSNWQETAGAFVHELCHVKQIHAGRAYEDATGLEIECSCEEYFYYENIGYEPGMYSVLHYAIP